MTFGFARKFISRLESFLPIDPISLHKQKRPRGLVRGWSLINHVTNMHVSRDGYIIT